MKTIKKGDKGDEVVILQRLLRKYDANVVADGDFGNKSDIAIKNFQTKFGLGADGVVGPKTWNALFDKAGNILGTDVYRNDATANRPFYQDLENNYWFCFAKSSQGSTFADARFGEHIAALKESHILRGAYHFPRLLRDNVDEEVAFYLKCCKDGGLNWSDKGVLPPVYDVEPLGDNEAAAFTANRTAIVGRMKKWLTAVEQKTGRKPIIYTSRRVWDELLRSPKGFESYSLWVADYGKVPSPRLPSTWNSHMIWQFTENGTVGGNVGFDVDSLNVSLGDLLARCNY